MTPPEPVRDYRTPRWIWLLGLVAAGLFVGTLWREESRQNDGSQLRVVAGADAAEAADLLAAGRTAYDVLASPEFAAVLRAAAGDGAIYAARDRQSVSADQVLEDLSGAGRYLPADITLLAGQRDDPASWHHASAGGIGYFRQRAEVVLGREVLSQWRAADAVERSCAVNTLAHEVAHTVSTSPLVFTNAFTDTRLGEREIPGRRDRSTPVASYLIGASAQCAWLQQQGRVARSAEAARACVHVFGTRGFNDRCRAFAQGETVRERPGLPPTMPPL